MTTEWLVNKIWENMESVQQFQQDLTKITIEFIRKQKDYLSTFQQKYDQLEEEAKKFLEKLLGKAHDEEISETWDEIAAMMEKNNELTLRFFEISQQKMYEFINGVLNEQQKLQKEIVQNIESFMRQKWDCSVCRSASS